MVLPTTANVIDGVNDDGDDIYGSCKDGWVC